MLRSIQKMTGFTIRASDGDIGRVEDFYFEDECWVIRYLVVATGPWLVGRKVLVAAQAAGLPQWDDQAIPVAMTKQQVKDSPEMDLHKPVSQKQLEALHDHYGWPYSWSSATYPAAPGVGTFPLWRVNTRPTSKQQELARTLIETETRPCSLRSAHEVVGYDVHAADGDIGHVRDFFARETDWAIRYIVVETRDWLPGRKVLIAPSWIEGVSWVDRAVRVCHTREEIKESPEYDPAEPAPSLEYEKLLYLHYGRTSPWT
jgi:hypothetical protein